MPPTKDYKPLPKPKNAKDDSAAIALVLFAKNLEEIRRWYRGASGDGHQFGHLVMNEIVLTNVSAALELALKGEQWSPPPHNP